MATKITRKSVALTREQKLKRYEDKNTEWTGAEQNISEAFIDFKMDRLKKGSSKATLAAYDRMFKKLIAHYDTLTKGNGGATPVNWLVDDIAQVAFVQSLGKVSPQTVNHYLRHYRAFGNYCEEMGFIEGFKCPIKEVEPPAKEVYTPEELQALTLKPLENASFQEWRNYTVIMLLLSTAARTNSIINLKIKDVDLDSGYVTYNITKTRKVNRIGLEKKTLAALKRFIEEWRNSEDYEPEDYLFTNEYNEQLTRHGLYKAITNYAHKRGVSRTGLHLFRHTFAKEFLTSGGNQFALKKILGHSDMKMVNRYTNLYDSDVKEDIECFSPAARLKNSGKITKKKR